MMAGVNGVNGGVSAEQRGVYATELLVLDAQRTLLEQRIAYVRQSGGGFVSGGVGGGGGGGLKRANSGAVEGGKSAKRARQVSGGVDPKEALFGKCRSMLNSLKKNNNSGPFLAPVDPVLQQCLDYFDVVKKPMDLKTVGSKLKPGGRVYNTPLEFRDDMRQIFANCRLYNPPSHPLCEFAQKMEVEFEKKWKRSGIEQQWHDLSNLLEAPSAMVLPGSNVRSKADDSTHHHAPVRSAMAQGAPRSVSGLAVNQGTAPPLADMHKLEKELTELTDTGGAPTPILDETAPMPFVQRRQLSRRLDVLPEHRLREIGGILAESELAGEEEMDLDTLDNRTLWRLQQLADFALPDRGSQDQPENGVS